LAERSSNYEDRSVGGREAHLSAYVDECKNESPVVITRNGKATAVLPALKDDDDLERLMLATRPFPVFAQQVTKKH
jgi:antitoxin (DNA-binding transcriptional repressor) of toxin-antitoxin stability system